MTIFRWHITPLADGVPIRQVYGFCFDTEGRVLLLQDHKSKFTLPGGKPEPSDRDMIKTLKRECSEEAQIQIHRVNFLGYQEVREDDQAPYAQLRFVAVVKRWLPRKMDLATGETFRRYLAPLNKVPAMLNWGIDGLLQAASAASIAEQLGIDIRKTREEMYRD